MRTSKNAPSRRQPEQMIQLTEYPYLSRLETGLKKHELVQEITIVCAAHGDRISASKANRLANCIKKQAQQVEAAPVITYRDPTGEKAVNRVMHEKKNPTQPASTRGVLPENKSSSYLGAKQ